jgi:hypothetical protein
MKRLSIHNANHVEFSCILLDANSCKGLGGRQCVVSDGGSSYCQLKTYVDHEL